MARSAFLHPFTRPTASDFVDITRGEGAVVWDSEGNRYVDAMASLWYCQVGHGRHEIADAVAAQMRTLEAFHTFEMFTNDPAEQLCERLAALAPMPDARVFLTCSGSEAVDTAIKFARLHFAWQGRPERRIVVARDRAYHGVTYGGTSAQGIPPNKENWGPLLEDVVVLDADDPIAMKDLFADRGERIAAVITEPVQGAGGVYPPPEGYLRGLRELCDEHGALLIADEVVCGFGRLGSWWGSQHYGVEPDLVTFAKGASSGYLPLGGVLVGAAVREVFEADDTRVLRHGFTYSGHPSACTAALVNLDILECEDLPARASWIGERLFGALHDLVAEGLAAEVRGEGGVWGLGMNEGVSAVAVRDEMLRNGVIPRPIADHTVAFCPPLVIDEADLDHVVSVTRSAVESAADP
ncbi:MAG: aminotransferase class III-fold pyridoxal phosphate-dependent enzyme [Microthrixaceae bacterium]|nr:aminotransferase class III-fold pyridoxal phosphate-dependent enzyme [Microthrixaceae bacterium]